MSGVSGGGSSVKAGAVIASSFGIPAGFLECDGAAMSRETYAALFLAIGVTFGSGDGLTTFNIPDLRGVFIRGLDNGRGLDVGRGLGSYQADKYKSHSHVIPTRIGAPYQNQSAITRTTVGNGTVTNYNSNASGSNETAPKSVALIHCIKY